MRARTCIVPATWITSGCCASTRTASRWRERFLGLFTSSAYTARPWDIPLVRRKYESVMRDSGLKPAGHSGKALRHILETLPRDEMFQSATGEIVTTPRCRHAGSAGTRPHASVPAPRPLRPLLSPAWPTCRATASPEAVRERIEAMLRDTLEGERVDSTFTWATSPLARLHLIVRPKAGARVDVDARRSKRTSPDRAQLVRRTARPAGRQAWRGTRPQARDRYGKALPMGYIESSPPERGRRRRNLRRR
jgi:glutamate dehydrogenase